MSHIRKLAQLSVVLWFEKILILTLFLRCIGRFYARDVKVV